MSGYIKQSVAGLHDPVTGALVGFLGADGNEYIFPALEGPTTSFTDASGTPGNATVNATRGKVAIAAAASSVVVTNSKVNANSQILVTLEGADATLLYIKSVVPAAGSFTVTGNAAATAATSLKFTVVN